MTKFGTYYISRIEKAPQADWSEISNAIVNPVIVERGKFKYAIVDHSTIDYDSLIFGKLVKYQEIGINEMVNEVYMTVETNEVPKRIIATSPFIYSPNDAFLTYLHVWNNIRDDDFRKIFDLLVRQGAPVSGFRLNPISNDEIFVNRVKAMDRIVEINTRVVPPNPSFGPLWEEIKEYLKRRRLREVKQKEMAEKNSAMFTRIIEVIESRNIKPNEVDFGDKLLLMAMDGYGDGSVRGYVGKSKRRVKTSDARESFEFNRDPQPNKLAEKASEEYARVKKDRDWRHR